MYEILSCSEGYSVLTLVAQKPVNSIAHSAHAHLRENAAHFGTLLLDDSLLQIAYV